MDNVVNVRWSGVRQDAMTAAAAFAEIMASAGKHVQAFPLFDSWRWCAPFVAFNRVSSSPVRNHSDMETADIAVILDRHALQAVDIKEGTGENTVFILNIPQEPGAPAEKLNLENEIYTVDAASSPLSYVLPMTVLVKITELLPLDEFKKKMEQNLAGTLPPEKVSEIVKAMNGIFENERKA